MATTCKICTLLTLEQQNAIEEEALRPGANLTKIALAYNVPRYSLAYHMDHHCRKPMAMVPVEDRRILHAGTLLGKLDNMARSAEEILEQAKADDRPQLSLQAIRTLQGVIETVCKLNVSIEMMQRREEEQEAEAQSETVDQALRRLDPLGLRLFRVLMRHFQGHSIESGLQSLFREVNCYDLSLSRTAPTKPQERSPEIQPDPAPEQPNEEQQKAPPRTRTRPVPTHLPGGGRIYYGPAEEDPNSPENKRERDGAKHLHATLVGGYGLGKLPG